MYACFAHILRTFPKNFFLSITMVTSANLEEGKSIFIATRFSLFPEKRSVIIMGRCVSILSRVRCYVLWAGLWILDEVKRNPFCLYNWQPKKKILNVFTVSDAIAFCKCIGIFWKRNEQISGLLRYFFDVQTSVTVFIFPHGWIPKISQNIYPGNFASQWFFEVVRKFVLLSEKKRRKEKGVHEKCCAYFIRCEYEWIFLKNFFISFEMCNILSDRVI